MRHLLLLSFLILTGCQNVDGPFRRTTKDRADDPNYSIAEQQRRGRSTLGLPDDTGVSGPRAGVPAQISGGGY